MHPALLARRGDCIHHEGDWGQPMASVFLSYDREDAARARSVALALEKAGHSVWWDRQISGGAEYGTEIEEALGRAEAVVVLWSERSVRSAWVRDEAAAGRDAGKLVPARLDSTEPPMGFRQYQTVDLSRWKGGRAVGAIMELDRAILGLSGKRDRRVEPSRSPAAEFARSPLGRVLVGVLVAAGLLAATWAVTQWLARPEIPAVTVAAAENNAASRKLARDLFVKLGRLQSATPDALEIVDMASGRKPDFTFQVSASQDGAQAAANIALVGKDQTLLWSDHFERPANQYGDLQLQLAQMAAEVLRCASQGVMDKRANLDQRTLKLYLSGCARIGLAWTDFRGLVPTFREVTVRAPRFEDGWGKLIETEAYVIGWETLSANSPEARTLRADIVSARKINPRIAEAYWAEYVLLGPGDIAGSAEVVDRAMRENPEDPLVQGIQAGFFPRVGRMNEGVEASKRMVEMAPLYVDAMSDHIIALTYAGLSEAALKEIAKAERLWPGSRALLDAQFRFHARYGDPKEALRIARSGANPNLANFELFLQARIDPTKENVDRAIAHARAQVGRSPRGTGYLILTLAQFGREEEIYSILEKHRSISVYAPEMFFRPELRRFRHDVRFMAVMQRFGLVDYWRKSGKWPDFCFELDLPYDCNTEAAKLS
jgi:hypothetical protein